MTLYVSTPQAQCADISVDHDTITISGEIEIGDFEVFSSKATLLNNAVVLQGSYGGKLLEALKIRELVRAKQFSTYVHTRCESSCSLIWMAGAQRFKTEKALVGFHSAHYESGEVNRIGNTAIEAFLWKLERLTKRLNR